MLKFHVILGSFLLFFTVFTFAGNFTLAFIILLVFLVLTAYGIFNLRSGIFHNTISKVQNAKSAVAISFDDGPDEKTSAILDLLKTNGLKGNFFCIGSKMEKEPALTKRIFEEGHLLGNHGYSHSFFFPLKSVKEISEELEVTQNIVFNITGAKNLFFRPPFGVLNPNIVLALKKHKLIVVAWSIRSLDTIMKDKETVLKRITRKIRPGDIILLHDNSKDILWILTELIKVLKQKGLTSVRIDGQDPL